jgi:hypothetical protein
MHPQVYRSAELQDHKVLARGKMTGLMRRIGAKIDTGRD